MTYFLDFDRTLFDTDSFTPTLVNNPACADFKEDIEAAVITGRDKTIAGGSGRYQLWESLASLCKHGLLTFAPGELSKFVFPDVPEFLKRHGNESVIVTYGAPAFLKAKIESSLHGLPIEKIVYTHDKEKGIAIQHAEKKFKGPYMLVDDLASQLDSIAKYCPEVTVYEIRRDAEKASGRHKIIHSLTEIK